jgi:PAS domain-containing protein
MNGQPLGSNLMMDPTHNTMTPGFWSTLRASWGDDTFLPWAFLTLALTPLFAAVLPPEATFYISRSFGIALVLFALVPPPLFERSEETLFWRYFSLAFGFWLLSRTVEIIGSSPASIELNLLIESLLGGHYIYLVLALERKPHHPERRREGLEGTLISPTAAVFVVGLFLYFVLIPLSLATSVTYEASFYFYFTLDGYLLLRLLYLRSQARYHLRWRLLYSLMAAGTTLTLLGDFDSLHQNLNPGQPFLPGPLPLILWILPFFPFLLLARLRHAQRLPKAQDFKITASPPHSTTSLRTLLAALAFPLIHILGDTSGLLDPRSVALREGVVLIWLVLLGGLALGQHRLANRRAQDLAQRKALTAAALAKNQTSLHLLHERKQAEQQLHAVELRCATIFRASPSGLLICDLADGRIREVNQNFERISERPREALLQQTIPGLNLWAAPTQHAQMVNRLEKNERIHNEIVELVLAPQKTCKILLSAEILQTEGLPAMLCVLRRIPSPTNSPNHWLSSTDLSIVGIDTEGLINVFSRGAERLYGVPAEQALGRLAHQVSNEIGTLDSTDQEPRNHQDPEEIHLLQGGLPRSKKQRIVTRCCGESNSLERLVLTIPIGEKPEVLP